MGEEQAFDDPILASVLGELRSWGRQPVARPSAALASLLDPAATPLPPRRKRMITTKLAGLGLAAKIALGVGVAAAAATTATVSASLLPSSNPGSSVTAGTHAQLGTDDTAADPTTTITQTTTTLIHVGAGDDNAKANGAADDQGDDGPGTTVGGPATAPSVHPDNHGGCVSEAAQDTSNAGRDHGQAVSAIARSDCGKDTTTTTEPTATTVAGAAASSHGNDNGNQGGGKGNGRS